LAALPIVSAEQRAHAISREQFDAVVVLSLVGQPN
jgi:hypothetical protein